MLPSFTFVATANAVLSVGAKPVFVDIKKEDYTIDQLTVKVKFQKKQEQSFLSIFMEMLQIFVLQKFQKI